MVKLSIIVPVYNVEKYLRECVDSILNQKFQDFELILVNDGSSDSSGLLCDEYSDKDTRIKTLHKKNGGQSSARNMGIDIAVGDYIGFVDSDDWIHENMYEKLIKHGFEYGSDIVACNFWVMKKDGGFEPYNKNTKNYEFTQSEAMAEIYKNKILTFSPCNKIYKSHLFNKLKFIEGIILEDKDISYKLIYNSNKVSYIEECLYFYRYNNESTLRRSFSNKRLDEYKVQVDMYNFYKKNYPEISELVYYDVFDIGSYLYSQIKAFNDNNLREYNYLLEFDKDILINLINNKQISIKKRIKLLIGITFPRIWILLRTYKK